MCGRGQFRFNFTDNCSTDIVNRDSIVEKDDKDITADQADMIDECVKMITTGKNIYICMVVIYQIEELEITRYVFVEDNSDQPGTYKLSLH